MKFFPHFRLVYDFFLLILFLCRIFFVIAQPSLQNVHRIEIPYRAFPERVGPRIISLESVDYFGTDHFSIRKKKDNFNERNFKVYWKIRIEDRLKKT